MKRRGFVQTAFAALAAPWSGAGHAAAAPAAAGGERALLLGLLEKMATPVLSNMANGRLKRNFPLELSPTWDGRSPAVAYLECFGRLMSGIAPWLALPDDASAEGQLRARLREQALRSLAHSVDPSSPDYLAWQDQGQALVDSAYFTSALMRAPKALWEPLDSITRQRIVTEIKLLRRIDPPFINWLLFAAMNEAFLLSVGEQHDPMRMNTAIRKLNEWYVGDGWIRDGDAFHFDYYGAYVMHPMLLAVTEVLERHRAPFWNGKPADLHAQALKRMQRFAEHLERFISPQGTFPPIGRSLTYRTAAFQPLALLAWRKQLPASLPEGQVRAAMHAVHQAVWSHPGNFTGDGFLTIGLVGHQNTLADWYSNNGSMYIAAESLLSLGLPVTDSYWTAPAQDWTQKKAFAGAPFPKDYPVPY